MLHRDLQEENIMLEPIDLDLNVLIMQTASPLILIFCVLCIIFGAKLLPRHFLLGWKVSSIGFFVAIFGGMIEDYFPAVKTAGSLFGVGFLLFVIGAIIFFATWIAHSFGKKK